METHTIKIKEKTYNRLEEIRQKRETFDGVVARLISLYTAGELMQDRITRQGHTSLRK